MKPNAISKSPGTELAEAIDSNAPVERIVEVLSQALAATVTTRSGAVEPDTQCRLKAAELLLKYRVGLPVQRSEVVNVNFDAEASMGLEERLATSPALRRNLKAVIAKVDSADAASTGGMHSP